MYRWVDDHGQVHYQDRIPPEDIDRSHSQLNQQGVTVDKVEAAKTKEELELEAEMERLRAERQRLIDKQEAEDQVLLKTFRSEDDILITRNVQLQAIDTYISVNRANIKRLKLKIEELQKEAARSELSGKHVSEKIHEDIELKNTSLHQLYQSIVNQEHEKDRIRSSFAKDLDRFRDLKQLTKSNDPVKEAKETFIQAIKNIYTCGDDKECKASWRKAREYMLKYNTTKISMDADNILMGGAPQEDKDLSITLSRLWDEKRGETFIFLDLQCRDTLQGRDLCNSETATRIIDEFQGAIKPH